MNYFSKECCHAHFLVTDFLFPILVYGSLYDSQIKYKWYCLLYDDFTAACTRYADVLKCVKCQDITNEMHITRNNTMHTDTYTNT